MKLAGLYRFAPTQLALLCALMLFAAPPLCAQSPECGNEVCEPGEDCVSCEQDCIDGYVSPFCGDGTCQTAAMLEDCRNCPEDCNGRLNGNPAGRFCCGEGDGLAPIGCGDLRCSSDGFDCVESADNTPFCCGDGRCDVAENGTAENSARCALDCGDDVGPCREPGGACEKDLDCCSNRCQGKKCRHGFVDEG